MNTRLAAFDNACPIHDGAANAVDTSAPAGMRIDALCGLLVDCHEALTERTHWAAEEERAARHALRLRIRAALGMGR
jgi:hypothetical protein